MRIGLRNAALTAANGRGVPEGLNEAFTSHFAWPDACTLRQVRDARIERSQGLKMTGNLLILQQDNRRQRQPFGRKMRSSLARITIPVPVKQDVDSAQIGVRA